MATEPKTTGLTYEDLQRFPEDNFRRELIDGELIVTPAPATRHQEVVLELGARLLAWTKERGGKAYIAPTDVVFSDTTVLEPDVLFLHPENVARAEKRFIRGSPDVVVEVSTPSTRRLELVRKREVYERFRAREFWYIDLDADRVEIYRLEADHYGPPQYLGRGDDLTSPEIPGFSISLEDLLGPPPEA